MKMNVRLFNAPGSTLDTPAELRAVAQTIAQELGKLMRLHGIMEITAKPVQVGSRSVLDKTFVPLPVTPPGAYLAIRGEAVSALIAYMALFGITGIALEPTSADLAALTQEWADIMAKGLSTALDYAPKSGPAVDPVVGPVDGAGASDD